MSINGINVIREAFRPSSWYYSLFVYTERILSSLHSLLTMKIAIFGGSFNPIHNGHIALARSVIEQRKADEVWLLVSPHNPLKPQRGLLPEELRLRIAREAVADIDGIRVSDVEFRLPRPSYTWATLGALSSEYPEHEFSLLIGADNWALFPRWAHYSDILERYSLLVYPRPGYPLNSSELPPNVHLIAAPEYPFSSTEVRHRLRQGLDVSGMVPPCVEQELREYKWSGEE